MIFLKKIHSILGAGFLASWQGLFSIIQRKGWRENPWEAKFSIIHKKPKKKIGKNFLIIHRKRWWTMKKNHPDFFPSSIHKEKGYEYKYLALHSFLPIHKKCRWWTERILPTSFLYHPRGEVLLQIIWVSFFRLHSGLFFFVCITCRLCAICFLVFTLSQHLRFCRCISLWKADLELLRRGFRCFFMLFFFLEGFSFALTFLSGFSLALC